MSDAFSETLKKQTSDFGVNLTPESISALTRYYQLVLQWNARLHLVAPCSPEEFATRHVLESLILLQYMGHNARVVDVGSGAGLPIIPCLIARPDLSAVLIESSTKKVVFLREALRRLDRNGAAAVLCTRFEDIQAPDADYLTCRALDQFTSKVSSLLSWAPPAMTLLFFAGESISDQLKREAVAFEKVPIPHSDRRSLLIIRR